MSLADSARFIRSHGKTFFCHYIGFSFYAMTLFCLMSWTPAFYIRRFGMSPVEAGYTLGTILLVANTTGVFCGGWLNDWLLRRGRSDGPMLAGCIGATNAENYGKAKDRVAENAARSLHRVLKNLRLRGRYQSEAERQGLSDAFAKQVGERIPDERGWVWELDLNRSACIYNIRQYMSYKIVSYALMKHINNDSQINVPVSASVDPCSGDMNAPHRVSPSGCPIRGP